MSRTTKDTRKWRASKADQIGVWIGCIGGVSPVFKRLRRRKRRAMEKEAVRLGAEPPRFRRCDEYDWF